ncbi:MAG: glucose-6-phosphate dehydrogenase, partial [Pyrinomonadaceae bacterium]
GALRDMVPNHIFQLVSLTAMEPPVSFEADALHNEQVKVLHSLQPLTEENVIRRAVRGQYGPGKLHGSETVAYRSEPKVTPNSNTETFFALKLMIDNWRWADIPFYVRTGKRMKQRLTEIVVQFKPAPYALFRHSPIDRLEANRIVIQIQPDEGISLSFGAKIPGPLVCIGNVDMDFRYRDYFGSKPSTGYERLLYDCMIGDATLFQRADMVELGWSVVAPIQEYWARVKPEGFPNYAAGSWGPEAATELLSRDGRRWRNIE